MKLIHHNWSMNVQIEFCLETNWEARFPIPQSDNIPPNDKQMSLV